MCVNMVLTYAQAPPKYKFIVLSLGQPLSKDGEIIFMQFKISIEYV
jgi:hypothetical protein